MQDVGDQLDGMGLRYVGVGAALQDRDRAAGFDDAAEQQVLWDVSAWRAAQPTLPPVVLTLLTLYEATARQDWPTVARASEDLLSGKAELTPAGVKEQALVLGMLAGLALGEADAVQARETRWAATVPMGTLADSRRFLRAWESGGEPVCAAAQAKR